MAALRECRMAAWHMEIGSTIIHACVPKASRYRKGWTAREPLGRSMRAACGEVLDDGWQDFLNDLCASADSPVFRLSAAFTIAVAIVYHWLLARPRFGQRRGKGSPVPASGAAPDVSDMRARIAVLESAAPDALQ